MEVGIINTLQYATGLRAWATKENLAKVTSELVQEAIVRDIHPSAIAFTLSDDFEQSGLYHIVLWGD